MKHWSISFSMVKKSAKYYVVLFLSCVSEVRVQVDAFTGSASFFATRGNSGDFFVIFPSPFGCFLPHRIILLLLPIHKPQHESDRLFFPLHFHGSTPTSSVISKGFQAGLQRFDSSLWIWLLDHDMNAASTRLTRCTSLACRSPYLPVIHSPHWILFGCCKSILVEELFRSLKKNRGMFLK